MFPKFHFRRVLLFLIQIVLLGTNLVTFGAQTCHVAGLVPPIWHPGGPLDDPVALRRTKKETLEPRLDFVLILNGLGPPFSKRYLSPWTKELIITMIASIA